MNYGEVNRNPVLTVPTKDVLKNSVFEDQVFHFNFSIVTFHTYCISYHRTHHLKMELLGLKDYLDGFL